MLERSRRIAGRGRKIGHPLNSTDEGSAGRGRRTGYRVGKIVMSIWRMIDTVLAAAASAPFQTADLRHQPIMARQDNLAAVEAWQQLLIQIALRLLAQFVADAVLAEWLTAEAVGLSRNTRAQESAEMRNFDRV